MLGHFPNSHFLQAGFCLLSTPEVTSIALSRKLTIFSQRSSGLACLLLEPFCSPESRISMFLPHNHCLHWLIFFFFFFEAALPRHPCHAIGLVGDTAGPHAGHPDGLGGDPHQPLPQAVDDTVAHCSDGPQRAAPMPC